jgi:hypothetical protein
MARADQGTSNDRAGIVLAQNHENTRVDQRMPKSEQVSKATPAIT